MTTPGRSPVRGQPRRPAALQTALALHQGIWRKPEPGWHVCGIPAVLYIDHGSDFTSRHLEQVAADLKIQLVFSLPGQPRGRGKIERYMDTINQTPFFGNELVAVWTGKELLMWGQLFTPRGAKHVATTGLEFAP